MASAWQLALSPPSGAVHLSLAPDLVLARVPGKPSKVAFLPLTPVSESNLSQFLRQADNLIIIAGIGVEVAQAQSELIAMAEEWGLLMDAGALATVARIGLSLIMLVVVDEALSLIRLKQLRQELPV